MWRADLRPWFLVALWAGCADDDGVWPTPEQLVCAYEPDAATALGVRGQDLWAAFVGTYTLVAQGSRFENNRVSFLEQPATFTITVSPSDQQVAGLTDCSRVAVPVQVMVQSADPPLNESVPGVLSGSPWLAEIHFDSPAATQNTRAGFWGTVLFRAGEPTRLDVYPDAITRWTAPPPMLGGTP